MTEHQTDYRQRQRQAFAGEVQAGTYHAGHEYGHAATSFVLAALEGALGDAWRSAGPLRILECGAGAGPWLEAIARARTWGRLELSGFDLTTEMIELAARRFAALSLPQVSIGFLRPGDITQAEDYYADRQPTAGAGYDLVYCYDVIQQLPPALRPVAVRRMLDAIKPSGRVVVFDKHKFSRHGLAMATKKWITAHTPLALVPRFYLNARYPNLWSLARHARRAWGCATTLVPDASRMHFALVLSKSSGD